MNPTNRKIPISETKIACNTSPAGPSFSIALKMNPITQSETGIGLTLGPILTGHIAVDVLPIGKLIAQSAAKSVCGETSDLVDLGEVLAAHREEKVACDAMLKRECKLGPARRCPIHGSSHKTGASSGHVQRPDPIPWKVGNLIGGQRQDMRALIPEPMLLVRAFQSTQPAVFNAETVAIFEESFAGGNNALTVGRGAAHAEPILRGDVKGCAGQKLDGILTKPLVGADSEYRRPSFVPMGTQTDVLGLGCAGVVEEVDVLADSEFVFGVFAETGQGGRRVGIMGIKLKDL